MRAAPLRTLLGVAFTSALWLACADDILVTTTRKVPCGTGKAAACAGAACKEAKECASGECASGKCTDPETTPPPLPNDGRQNGDETDVDCGGASASKCNDGKHCKAGPDCISKVCAGDTCAVPSPTDGAQNGNETDVDCGGATAPKCATGLACAVNTDCGSDGCADTKTCADRRSCTSTNGGLTCGTGEVGQANAQHESCCLALPIPGMQTKLDKYLVTAGRMRAFAERTRGDIRGWFTANRDTLPPATRAQIEGFEDTLPVDLANDGTDGRPVGVNQQLGGFIFLPNMPSTSQGCFVGNAQERANGSHTYWNGTLENEDRGFDQAFLDRLPLNCVPFPVLAAFCAWDGGRVQTFDENSAAYGPGAYPWGNAPEAGGFVFGNGGTQQVGPARYPAPVTSCPGCDVGQANWLNAYQNPPGGNPAKSWDYAYFISPPGRFPLDKGPGGHLDIGADLMEWTATSGPIPGGQREANRWARAGSWEGHQMNYGGFSFPRLTKYGKTGGRCARD